MKFSLGHSGTTTLPLAEESGYMVPDASVTEVRRNARHALRAQVQAAISAERLGFDQVQFPEQHFELTGVMNSPDPIVSLSYVAAKTDDIQLLQMANVLPWHHPIQVAERTAMLDTLSDGRVQVGIGRGYTTRSAEAFRDCWGVGINNQPRNRAVFEEAYDAIVAAWTADTFTHDGFQKQYPPKYVPHDYGLDHAYVGSAASRINPEEVIESKKTSTLTSLTALPQPVQDPHPQVWQPLQSEPSIRWAARNGVNGYAVSIHDLENTLELYYEEAAETGWPDRRDEYDGEKLAYGWDAEKRRGVIPRVFVFNTDVGDEGTFEAWKRGHVMLVNHLASAGAFDLDFQDTEMEEILGYAPLVYGGTNEIIEQIRRIRDDHGYEDFLIDVTFDSPGLSWSAQQTQMETFAELVMPNLETKGTSI